MRTQPVDANTLLLILQSYRGMRKERKWAPIDLQNGSIGLLPVQGTQYLYRGQTQRFSPCLPTILRNVRSRGLSLKTLPAQVRYPLIADLIRADWFCEILRMHPVIKWAKDEHLDIGKMALAQHYGVPTGYIDLTESYEIALLFATCRRDPDNRTWIPLGEGTGIIYMLDWANTVGLEEVRSRIRPIGFQPFPRPREQWAWTIEMTLGEDFESLRGLEAMEFKHSPALGQQVLEILNNGTQIYPHDVLADWAVEVRNSHILPKDSAEYVLKDLSKDPNGIDLTDIARASSDMRSYAGVQFTEKRLDRFAEESIPQLQKVWEANKEAFLKSLNHNFTPIIVREPKVR